MTIDQLDDRFVVARVRDHLVGLSIAKVVRIDPGGTASEPGLAIEDVLGLDGEATGGRVILELQHRGHGVTLAVPGANLEIGKSLSGPCESPELIAGALSRCCLRGVVRDADSFVYLVDLDTVWSRFVAPESGASP